MSTYSPINYDEIVANIRADAAKLAPQPTQLPTVTAPAFEDFANPLGYANTDYEGKLKIQQSWLNQYGQAWRNGGANPEQDLKTYAATVKPTASIFDTDWLDLAKQAANKSVSSIANVAANEMAPGLIKTGLSNIGASYAQDAKINEASFSPVTRDRQIREARQMAELMAAGGSELDAAALTARHVAERPVATLANAAGSMVTQLPAIGLQAVGGALVGTGAGAPVGAGLIAAGRGLGVVTSTASVAGEVGQGAYDTVIGLPTSKVSGHPEFKNAYDQAIALKLSPSEASLVAHRAVASAAMSEGMKYGAGIGAVSGAISSGFGAGKIAENAGKKAATEFLKRSGIELVSEGSEEAIGQVAQNKAANSGGANVPLTQGTGSAFVEGTAGGLGLSAASSGAGKAAAKVVDKFTAVPSAQVVPTTKEDLVAKTSQMPEYVQAMAADLIDTIIANPTPTPEVAAGIEAAKAQLVEMGMTPADIQGLFAEQVTPDAPAPQPTFPATNAKEVQVGTYKPSETGGQPGTEAPTRLVKDLAKEGELTLEAINSAAATHEQGYTTWVQGTQSEPSRIPKQEFIAGTADNMAVTALNMGLPMDANLKAYAEMKSLELGDLQSTDTNLLGSRLMADGETLMSESQYQATQSGVLNNLVGEYVQYGNTEGYVVERPQGLYVVDTRPGKQDAFIESGQAGLPPAQIGVKLLPPPSIKLPSKRVGSGQTPRQLVADAQLNYDQIKLNDALDLLVLSMPAAEAEAFLEGLDDRLSANVTPAQVAKEIEDAINQSGTPQTNTLLDAVPSNAPEVSSPDAGTNAETGSALGRPTPTSAAPDWTPAGVETAIQQWLTSLGGGRIPTDVKIMPSLPAWALKSLQAGVDSGELRLVGNRGQDVDTVSDIVVNGARRENTTYLFAGNMDVNADPISILLHETWHKFQNVEGALRLNEAIDRWATAPKASIEYRAWAIGEAAIDGDITGGSLERLPKILNFLWAEGVRPTQRTPLAKVMDSALALLRRILIATGAARPQVSPEDLIGIAQRMVVDDSNGKEASLYLSNKTMQARSSLARKKVSPAFSVADIAKLSDKGMSLKEFSQQFAGSIKQSDRKVEDADSIALDYLDAVIKDPASVLPTVTGATLSYKQYLMMPDGKSYDPQNLDHITATDLTKAIYRAVSEGTIAQALAAEAKATNESRAKDLRGLARYLKGNPDYRATEGAIIAKAAAKWGMRLTTNNDKAEVQLVEITNKNATAIAVVNGLDAAALSNKLFEGLPLKAAFQAALQETTDNREKAAKASGREGWVVYKKSDKYEDHVALRDGCAGREWCTAGAVSTAANQLRQGDFHVFYAKGQPIVALRTENGRLGEAPRGSLPGQALTDAERGIAERRLRGIPESGGSQTPTVQGGEDFLTDQKVLADIQSGAINSYSDTDLWMLQGYRLKAGSYADNGGRLPQAADEAIGRAITSRRLTTAEWNAAGYYVAFGAHSRTAPDWTGVKYVAGMAFIHEGTVAPDLVMAGEVAANSGAQLPKLTKVLGKFVASGSNEVGASVSTPVLASVGGSYTVTGSDLKNFGSPMLREVGDGMFLSSSANEPSMPVFPSLVKISSIEVEGELGASEPTLKDVAPKAPKDTPFDVINLSAWEPEDFSIGDRARLMLPRKQPRSLEERLTIIEQGELAKSYPLWQDIKDWTAKVLVDGTRPFDAWARTYGTKEDQAALIQKKAVAKTRVSSYVASIDGKYTRELAKGLAKVVKQTKVRDTLAAKELVGTWMTVRYAQVKNLEFIKQDQAEVDKAEAAFTAAGGDLVGLRADLARVSTTTVSAARLTQQTELAAKRFAKATDATRSAATAYVRALDQQAKRLQAINDPNKNLDPVATPVEAGLAGGYNNATAAEVQRLIETKIPVALLEEASKPVYEMLAENLRTDLRNGKLALSVYAKWGKDPLYVPLTGDPRTDDTASDVFGTGSVNQSKDKRAEGRSSSLAQNGIDAAYEQVGKSAQYHGWLPFKQELTKIYERLLAENGGNAAVVYETYGIKRRRETEMTDLSSSVIFRNGADVTRNGGGWAYTFDSVAAIEALRHANMEQRPGWLAPVGWATTMAAKMITQFTPGFALINAMRDGPERFLNLSTRKLGNYPDLNMGKVAADALVNWGNPLTILTARIVLAEKLSLPELVKSISQSIPDFTPQDTVYLREMLDAGASSTTGAYLSRESQDLAEKLAKINGWGTKTKNMLVIWNDSFELKAPYSMYKALRENGVDKDAAASTVLSTMDFGKAGTAMAPIKALYMFAQPIATGAHQMVLTLSTNKGKALALGMTVASMGLYALLSDMAGEDEETKRKRMASISSTTLERSVPIILADGTVIKVPVPFGIFQLAWGVGANVMRTLNGEQSALETVGELTKLGVKTFSPISTSETSVARDPTTWAVQTFTPTELKPIANAALNRGAFGGKLDSREFLDPSQAKWKFAKPGTPELYVEASKWLLVNTGMNTSPEVIKELSNMAAVGPLAEARKGLVDNPTKDAHGVKRPSQWFDRYLAVQTTADVISPAYYHTKDQVSDIKAKLDAGKEITQGERQLVAISKADDASRKAIALQWGALRKQENANIISEPAYKERFQTLKKLELEAQKRFLIRYNELSK